MISGKPVLYYTLEVLEGIEWLRDIIVPVAEENVARLSEQAASSWGFVKCRFVPGGATRHRSISAGLAWIDQQQKEGKAPPPDVVIIHDAVRPFVEADLYRAIAEAGHKHGAVSRMFCRLVPRYLLK